MRKLGKHRAVGPPGLSPYYLRPGSYANIPTCGGCLHAVYDKEAKGHGCQLAFDANGRWCGVIDLKSAACAGWQERVMP